MGAGGQAQTPGMMNRPDMPAQAVPQMQRTFDEMAQQRFGQLPQQAQNNMQAWWGQQSPIAPGQSWWMQNMTSPWQQQALQTPWVQRMMQQAPQLPQQAQMPGGAQNPFTNTMGMPSTGYPLSSTAVKPIMQRLRGY